MQQVIPNPKPLEEENEFLDSTFDSAPDQDEGLQSVRRRWIWGFFLGTILLIAALVLYASMVLRAGPTWFPPPPPMPPALGG